MFSHEQYAALTSGAGMLDRSGRGRIALTGADRRGYLHGLLTNDILALSPGAGCYAALLTPQGRMISDMRVSELGEQLLIDLPAGTCDTVRSRLADFIFTEDVEVHDVRGSLAHLAVYGPAAAAMLAAVLDSRDTHGTTRQNDAAASRRERLERQPLNANSSWESAGARTVVVASDDYGAPGFELFVAPAVAGDLQDSLRRLGALDVALDTAHICRVEAGRPEFGTDIDEHTIPLEAGIEDRAISLTKGCYVGQEVIIRVLHRGQGRVAKRLVGLAGASEAGGLSAGQKLLSADGARKDVGVITSAVMSPRLNRPIALGYVHRDHAEPGSMVRGAADGGGDDRPLTVTRVPFIPRAQAAE